MCFRKQIIGLALIILLLFSTHATARGPQQEGREGGKLIYGLTLSPSGIDPHVNASSELGIPLANVYDPLVWQVGEAAFMPGLAKSWEISPDGLTYTFHLRDDVIFHDGTPFNAGAVQTNLERIAAPDTKSQKAVIMLGPYDHTEIVDDYTVRIVLREPFAPLLDSLSQVYLAMASPAALEKWGQDYQMRQVGTGPFRFKEYVPGDHLSLTVFPEYNWAPEFFEHNGRAYLDEIEFRFFTEPASRVLALEGNEADVMGEIPPLDAPRLQANDRFALLPVHIPGMSLQMFINTQKFPTDDLNVRQALLYAADRQIIIDTIFKGFSPVAYGPLSSETLEFDDSLIGSYAFDLEKAKQILEEAGWTDPNNDGIREKDGQPLRIEGYLMTWGFIPEIGGLLQAQMKEAGIDLQNRTVAYPAALDAAQQGNHHLIPFNLSNTDPDILRTFFLSRNVGTGFNWSKIEDPELDRLLLEGAQTLDTAARVEIYQKIQRRIMEQALIIPLREYVNINARAAHVQGLQFDIRGWFPLLYDTYLEK